MQLGLPAAVARFISFAVALGCTGALYSQHFSHMQRTSFLSFHLAIQAVGFLTNYFFFLYFFDLLKPHLPPLLASGVALGGATAFSTLVTFSALKLLADDPSEV